MSASEPTPSASASVTAKIGTRHVQVRTVKLPTCAVSAPHANRMRIAAYSVAFTQLPDSPPKSAACASRTPIPAAIASGHGVIESRRTSGVSSIALEPMVSRGKKAAMEAKLGAAGKAEQGGGSPPRCHAGGGAAHPGVAAPSHGHRLSAPRCTRSRPAR